MSNDSSVVIVARAPTFQDGDAPAARRDLIITADSAGQLQVQVGGRIVIDAEEERNWANAYRPRRVTTLAEATAVSRLLALALAQVSRHARVPNQDATDIFVFDLTPPARGAPGRRIYLEALAVLSAIDAPLVAGSEG